VRAASVLDELSRGLATAGNLLVVNLDKTKLAIVEGTGERILGIIVGEKFHPFTGGAETDILGIPMQETSLTSFYLSIVMILSAIYEGTQFGRIDKMVKEDKSIIPGDLGFDPLNIKPKKPDEWLAMQNKELLNGRLAMIAFAGIVGQEQLTNTKIFR